MLFFFNYYIIEHKTLKKSCNQTVVQMKTHIYPYAFYNSITIKQHFKNATDAKTNTEPVYSINVLCMATTDLVY